MKQAAAVMNDEAAIRRQMDDLLQAIRAMDLNRVTQMFASDMVSFDVEPPLQHLGLAAKSHNWEKVFAAFEPPLGYEVRELAIFPGGAVAFAHSLNRLSGTMKNGMKTAVGVRSTLCFEKVGGRWLIVHDHVSVPLDVASGRGLVNLEP
jgi:uncharacterized protein (TIGR02246 family)